MIARHGEAQRVDDAKLVDEIRRRHVDRAFRRVLQRKVDELRRQGSQLANIILPGVAPTTQAADWLADEAKIAHGCDTNRFVIEQIAALYRIPQEISRPDRERRQAPIENFVLVS